MIATESIEKEEDGCFAETMFHCVVAAWYKIRPDLCDVIDSDVVYAEAPNEIRDVADLFLMRFWCEDSFR